MQLTFPRNPKNFLESGMQFWDRIRNAKTEITPPSPGWYPYESLSSMHTIAELLQPHYEELLPDLVKGRFVDLGCGDGELALLLASWGAAVDAVDCAENNYNRMEGLNLLSRFLKLPINSYSIDLDKKPELPRETYAMAFFLGTLYHLKNPYQILEQLAYTAQWCVLSTRIAQCTHSRGVRIESEPVAYLADGMEIGNDATNYWFFSSTALLRILQRTRWAIVNVKRIGCQKDSNPTDREADERMFVLMK